MYKNQQFMLCGASSGPSRRWALHVFTLFFSGHGGSRKRSGAMLTNLTTDRSALVALYTRRTANMAAQGGTNWLQHKSVCEWNGVRGSGSTACILRAASGSVVGTFLTSDFSTS